MLQLLIKISSQETEGLLLRTKNRASLFCAADISNRIEPIKVIQQLNSAVGRRNDQRGLTHDRTELLANHFYAVVLSTGGVEELNDSKGHYHGHGRDTEEEHPCLLSPGGIHHGH